MWIGSGVFDPWGCKNRGFPLTRRVALTTVLHYRADCDPSILKQNAVDIDVAQKPETHRTALHERGCGVYDKRSEHLPKRNICLTQFTQSYKYFYEAEDHLRVDMTFRESILSKARAWLRKVRTLLLFGVYGEISISDGLLKCSRSTGQRSRSQRENVV